MTWFRDIRRYVSYQQSQGLRPATIPRNRDRGYSSRNRKSYDRSSRNDYRDEDYCDRGGKGRSAAPDDEATEKPRHGSNSRSPSRSPRRSSNERSVSVDSRRSNRSEKSRRSGSRDSSRSAPRENTASPPPPASSPTVKREAIEKGETPPLPPSPPPAKMVDTEPKKISQAIEKGETPPLPPSPPPAKMVDTEPKKISQSASISPVERKTRKSKKDKKKRRRRSPSSSSANTANEPSSEELSEGELRKKILKKREKALKEEEAMESMKQQPVVKPTLGKWEEQEAETTLLQNTTLKFGLESTVMYSVSSRFLSNACMKQQPVVKPTLGKWEEQEAETTLLQNTTLKFGLESTEEVPKRVVRDAVPQFSSTKGVFSSPPPSATALNKRDGNNGVLSLSPQTTKPDDSLMSFAKKGIRDSGKQNEGARREVSLFSTDIDALLGKRPQIGGLDDFKSVQVLEFCDTCCLPLYRIVFFQENKMKEREESSARGQQSLSSFLDDTDETLQPTQGALRLSSFTRQLNAERERERKLARLPPEILSKYTAKKKQLEAIAVEFFAILLKYGFKELIFRHFKKISPPWMLERMLRSKGYYGLRRDFPPSNVFRDIDNLERSLDYAKWLEFITPFLREKDSRFRLARHHPFKQRMIQLREAVLNQDWSKVGAFIGLLPAFRRNLKEVPEPFRKQLENNSARTCGILQPYAATVFRSGMERFMHHDIPVDMITKSAAELMLALINAERRPSNTLFDTENSSLLYVTELLIFAIANGQDQEAQDLIDATSSLPSITLSHRVLFPVQLMLFFAFDRIFAKK
ncbi:unnamed protein product [Gongylonema pulchrum]|uniref:Protein kinase domain-containing protein n=1 Tax=Gongylonema pulchrum TaxID=637853 RepID=A0A183DNJ2_9BILA|nr:unnamed protein product [Gongylonema pulchrum]